MPRYAALSKGIHANCTWRAPTNYAFARTSALVPLSVAELPQAVMAFPVGLFRGHDGVFPAAILSLENGSNLYVTPEGRWLARYIPVELRMHPFRLLQNKQDPGKYVLCIDEDSGLIAQSGSGQDFFNPDGSLTDSMQQVLERLSQHERDREATNRACRLLEQQGLVVPWNISIRTSKGDRHIESVCKIDERSLNALSGREFEALRDTGALSLAYCQMISMQNLPVLGKLAEAHDRHARKTEQLLQATLLQSEISTDAGIDWDAFSSQNHS